MKQLAVTKNLSFKENYDHKYMGKGHKYITLTFKQDTKWGLDPIYLKECGHLCRWSSISCCRCIYGKEVELGNNGCNVCRSK